MLKPKSRAIPFGDGPVVQLSPFGQKGWEPNGTNGRPLKASLWPGEAAWVLLEDRKSVLVSSPVQVMRDSRTPSEPMQVGPWRRFPSPVVMPFWLHHGTGWSKWTPPAQLIRPTAGAMVGPLEHAEVQQVSCDVQAAITETPKPTTTDAGVAGKSSGEDEKC